MESNGKQLQKANNINPCDTIFHASTILYRVPVLNYKTNIYPMGLHCAVYRSDVMPRIQGEKISFLYEYYFNYDTAFLEWTITKEEAIKIANQVSKVCKRYSPAWYKFWTSQYVEMHVSSFFGHLTEVNTIDFLNYLGSMSHDFEAVTMALGELGYTYMRIGSKAYDSLKDGKRGIHYDMLVFHPQNLKIKRVLQIMENALNSVVDITPIMPTLSI